MEKISVLIVNYNASQLLDSLVHSIFRYHVGFDFEIIIVDNASNDNFNEISERLKKKYSQIKVKILDQNYGFAKANNIAASYAKGKYILLLNPDTLFLENSLEKVLNFRMEFNQSCIIGIQLLNKDRSVQPGKQVFPNFYDYLVQAFFLDSIFKKTRLFDRVNYEWQSDDEINFVDYVKGAFLFVDYDVYKKLGGLDETYFIYSEDVDFCYKAKKIDVNSIYFPKTSIIQWWI